MMERDRLRRLFEALALDRENRGLLPPTEAFERGAQQFMRTLPTWAEDDAAGGVYASGFEDGWLAALRHLKLALGLPEARGREREAVVFALEEGLAPGEIAARLRAAAPQPDQMGTIIPFPAPKPSDG